MRTLSTCLLCPLLAAGAALLAPGAQAGEVLSLKGQAGVVFHAASPYEFGLFPSGPGLQIRAETPPRQRAARPQTEPRLLLQSDGSRSARLKALIAAAEVGRLGYDAVHAGAARRTPARPTEMTVGEILEWVRDTPGQPHAIGRYQFVPDTLRDLLRRTGLPMSARFSPALQNRLADVLLADAGLADFEAGRLSRAGFMDNLARIWAGLPLRTGLSAYHGYAGNAATITRASFEREMARIFD